MWAWVIGDGSSSVGVKGHQWEAAASTLRQAARGPSGTSTTMTWSWKEAVAMVQGIGLSMLSMGGMKMTTQVTDGR